MKQSKGKNNKERIINTATQKAPERKVLEKQEQGNKERKTLKYPKVTFLAKLLILFAITIGSVEYGDNSKLFEPDNSNNHTEHKWKSFYEFTESESVDIIAIGTSKSYTALSPQNLTMALGANTFVLASPGTSMMDEYYCLEEALTRTTPKIVLIDTYNSTSVDNKDFKGEPLSCQLKSFKARRNVRLKLCSMLNLFSIDNIPEAWSNTIRNHNYIFRDTNQINTNKYLLTQPEKKDTFIYLGRFIRFQDGISDSVMKLYEKKGAPLDCKDLDLSKEYKLYANKIVDLCNQKGITPIFVTYPMYEKHIKNYGLLREKTRRIISETGAKWIDFQANYDTTKFTRLCFENTYNKNQHMTRIGSYIISYKIASLIRDSFKIKLPHRDNNKKWHEMFYGDEGYLMNYQVKDNDEKNFVICKDKKLDKIKIKEAFYTKNDNGTKTIFIKIDRKSSSFNSKKEDIELHIKGNYKGREVTGSVPIKETIEYTPLDHYLYISNLVQEFTPTEIVGAKIEERSIRK